MSCEFKLAGFIAKKASLQRGSAAVLAAIVSQLLKRVDQKFVPTGT